MKRILLATTLLVAAISSASAMTSAGGLNNAERSEILRAMPTANVDDLTNAQVQAIKDIFTGSGNDSAGESVTGNIRVILGWNS